MRVTPPASGELGHSRGTPAVPRDRTAIMTEGNQIRQPDLWQPLCGAGGIAVIEAGLKYNPGWDFGEPRVFARRSGFQSNLFTGTGFALLTRQAEHSRRRARNAGQHRGSADVHFGVTWLDPNTTTSIVAFGNLTGTRPAGIPEWTMVSAPSTTARRTGLADPARVVPLMPRKRRWLRGCPASSCATPMLDRQRCAGDCRGGAVHRRAQTTDGLARLRDGHGADARGWGATC